ncbi:MAG: competence/damage-inducible protein A [Armatimonadetes bacterium]|nr:competence/damage-inducible protein A [Armatimonadota bacterium]
MNAEIVSVGTELLLGQIIDTHAATMARILAECGITCRHRATVGDNFDRVVETLRVALSRADVVVTIGGLGPTADDLTRDAIAAALDDTLEIVPEVEEKLKRFFAQRGVQWVASNGRQAQKPTCADLIDNPNGTAPGLVCRKNGKTVFALPGPRGEFDPMAYNQVKPMLERLGGGEVIHSRVLRVIGVGESLAEEKIKHLMVSENPTIAPYAQPMEVHLRVTARAASVSAAEALIDPAERAIREILGDAVYGTNLTTLEAAVIELLKARGETISTAESMTGGGLAGRLTSVDGSSQAFMGGVVTYTVGAKQTLLDAPTDMDLSNPVSADVARFMAESVRARLGTTYAMSVTGNAGPTSDVGGQPVGLTYIGIASPGGTHVEECKFRGIRADIRSRAEQTALRLVREAILAR